MTKKTTTILSIVIALVMVLSIVGEASALGRRPLQFGRSGDDVRELQLKLNQLNYDVGKATGVYGQRTERAVIDFQIDNGLRIDGISDWRTINKINSKFYTVRRGDTLSSIARRLNTTVRAINVTNGRTSDRIYPGDRLVIPESNGVVEATPANGAASRTVRANPNTNSFSRANVTQAERDLLARAVYSEARGESYEGQVAIAAVVLNRVQDDRFPDTIRGVIFQPWAFSAVHDGQFWLEPDAQSRRAVEEALNGWDPTRGAAFYYNPVTATSQWMFDNMTSDVIIGKHHFSLK
ncbi:cell wall hydrolase [Halonatronum saccharophilum]|uniref:cell wall hydrolase n=1 Tax=Halonatronum saccharophilum TaxID=150060 RepID=UPI0004814236|nr:cell wall hydrolase [Halonatronum saccharophilum]